MLQKKIWPTVQSARNGIIRVASQLQTEFLGLLTLMNGFVITNLSSLTSCTCVLKAVQQSRQITVHIATTDE